MNGSDAKPADDVSIAKFHACAARTTEAAKRNLQFSQAMECVRSKPATGKLRKAANG